MEDMRTLPFLTLSMQRLEEASRLSLQTEEWLEELMLILKQIKWMYIGQTEQHGI